MIQSERPETTLGLVASETAFKAVDSATTQARIAEIPSLLEREFAYYAFEHQHPMNRLTHLFGIPVLLGTMALALVWGSWQWFVGGQVVGWSIQLVGHRYEGNKPAFLKRPLGLIMGQLMVLVEIAELLGLQFAFAERARRVVGIDQWVKRGG